MGTNNTSSGSRRFALEVAVLTVGWYGASIISSNTTKQLLNQELGQDNSLRIDPLSLTCIQLWLSAFCGFILIRVVGLARWRSLFDNTTTVSSSSKVAISASKSLFARMSWLGIVFLGGFLTLNAAMRNMSVSLANTLRALEPIVSLFLSYAMLDRRSVTPALVIAVMPIVVGAAMASYGNAEFTIFGFMVIMMSNVCFALRTVLYKGIRQTFGLDNITMFFHVCLVGACVSSVGLILIDIVFVDPAQNGNSGITVLVQELIFHSSPSLKILLLSNGVTFFM
jgi:drug/metabolite transporter (DMT)-like permease